MSSVNSSILKTPKQSRRRQWGSERSTTPLSMTHDRPSDRKLAFSRLAIVATVIFWAGYVVSTIVRQFLDNGSEGFRFTMEAVSYLIVVTFLGFSALLYLIARHGALQRFSTHVRVPRAELDRHVASVEPGLTVLIPSYSEEPNVVRATVLSAALQEYPGLRVVVLLDDPPFPSDPDAAAKLARTRQVSAGVATLLDEPSARFRNAQSLFELELHGSSVPTESMVQDLAEHYHWAARWLEERAQLEEIDDHVAVFFVDQVLMALSLELQEVSDALLAAVSEGQAPTLDRMQELHRRLVSTFTAELVTFERKRYASLSHEANKAMNLNSYLGLMGGRFRTEPTPAGDVLREVADHEAADLVVPDTEFVLTLDADSILLREYCLRLVYLMHQSHNERIAVAQTPYSSFRGAPTRIERLAGATTDIQHILHQGMSHYDATFWVGANAVIRKRALDDIVETEWVGGFEHRRYVQDRTVIEDTESSIDLGSHGWTLINYPERLSYSATPPDFGSLVVQRRRWANGGLLILPKLFKQVQERKRRGERVRIIELLLRVNYMASIFWSSVGLVFLLAYPYDSRFLSPLVLLAAVPYFWAMGSDLRYCGYRFTDIFRIYGFNLILLPVNLAGVLKSLEQAITGKKIPFARTPKVRSHTASPALYVIAPVLIVAFSALTLWRDLRLENWGNAAFAAVNAVLALSAFFAYIGLWHALVDVWLAMTRWLYVDAKPQKSARVDTEAAAPELDWRAVLYHGHSDVVLDGAHGGIQRERMTRSVEISA